MRHIYVGDTPHHGDGKNLVAVCGARFEYSAETAANAWSKVTCPACLAKKEQPHFLAVGPNCWGRGDTQDQAVRNMHKANGRKADRYVVYLCDCTTWVDGFGTVWSRDGSRKAEVVLDRRNKPADLCRCGSGLRKRGLYDARGIFVRYVCDSCERGVKAGYRPEIFTDANYEASEPIDGDDPPESQWMR